MQETSEAPPQTAQKNYVDSASLAQRLFARSAGRTSSWPAEKLASIVTLLATEDV